MCEGLAANRPRWPCDASTADGGSVQTRGAAVSVAVRTMHVAWHNSWPWSQNSYWAVCRHTFCENFHHNLKSNNNYQNYNHKLSIKSQNNSSYKYISMGWSS